MFKEIDKCKIALIVNLWCNSLYIYYVKKKKIINCIYHLISVIDYYILEYL